MSSTRIDYISDAKSIFSVFPNPIKNYFSIRNESNVAVESVKIMDVLGRTVKQFDKLVPRLSLAELPSSLYFVLVKSKSGIHSIKIQKE